MFDILLENHIRKRTRIAKDARFKHDVYDVNSDAFGEVESIEQFIDKLAEAYDPTYNVANPVTSSVYLEYIIDNLKRNIIQFNEQSQVDTRRLLQHYHEDQSSLNPLMQRDFQRYYRDIIPTLQEALNEASAINKNTVANSPEFALYYSNNNAGVFGGQTQQQFYETLANLFDPSEDHRYMAYVVRNLLPTKNSKGQTIPPNITKEESPFIKSVLTAHMQQVMKGNVKIKRDAMRFYPRIKFDLIKALSPYVEKYNTTTNQSEAFVQTAQIFEERIGAPIFTNDSHAFYRLENDQEALKVLRTRQATDFPEVSRHCTGYWCLPAMTEYFPAWISVDAYGFVDYAFVPKPRKNYNYGEIKNRFNSQKSSITMTQEDHDSFVDFMLNSEDTARLTRPFKNILPSNYTGPFATDYGQFLVRCRDLQTFNRLSDNNFASVNEFIKWCFGVTASSSQNLASYQATVIPRYINFQRTLAENPDNFPLFEQFRGKAEGDTAGTVLDHSELAKGVFDDWMKTVQSFVNKFIKDKDASMLDSANLNAFKRYFASADTQTIMLLFQTKYNKVCDALARKVEDETLRFDGVASYQDLVSYSTMLTYNQRIIGKDLNAALRKAFATYLRTGGLQTMTSKSINASEYVELSRLVLTAGSNISDKAKINIIKIYMAMLQNAVEANDRNYTRASNLISGITDAMKSTATMLKMNEQDIAIAVAKAMNNFIQQKQQQNEKVDDLIIIRMYDSFKHKYEQKIKAYNNVAPLFIHAVATIDAKSKAHALHPNLFAVEQTSLAPILRTKLANKFASSNAIEYNNSDAVQFSNMQGELVRGTVNPVAGDKMLIKSSSWNTFAAFVKLALSDRRQRATSSYSETAFHRMRDTVNNLVTNYQATLVDVALKVFYNQPAGSASFVNRYKDSNERINQMHFIVRLKLNADDVKDKIVGVTEEGSVIHALTMSGAPKNETYNAFDARMKQMVAPVGESKALRIKKFSTLFERASLFDKCKHEQK